MANSSSSKKHSEPRSSGTATAKSKTKTNWGMVAIFLAAMVLVAVFIIMQSHRTPDNNKPAPAPATPAPSPSSSNGTAKLYLKSSSTNVSANSAVVFEIWVDTGGQSVNAVQANLTYPTDKFDFNSIDGTKSAFEVQALSKGGDGSITIARGHVGTLTGAQLISTVNLTAKSSKGAAELKFASGSAVVSATTHTNILKTSTGLSYTVSMLNSSPLRMLGEYYPLR